MSIENDKLLNLADGQLLYNDLRDRVEAKYTKPQTGIPASDIASGVIPQIDDTAGSGDTDKVWSADKSSDLLSAIEVLEPSATSSDIGKFLKAKTVADGKVTEYEFGEGGGSGGTSDYTDLENKPQINGTTLAGNKALQELGIPIPFSRFIGKKITIIGDSIDTFDQEGYRTEGYRMYYPALDVLDVNQTWWKIVLDVTGSTLERNLSYSGSCVTNARAGFPSLYSRISLIGNPDVVFITLGTNDQGISAQLGEYDFETTYTSLSETYFRTAYIKGIKGIRALSPNADIICIAEKMSDPYKESIIYIANELGCTFLDVSNYVGSSGVHPGQYGMKQIARNVLFPTDKTLTQNEIPADGKKVGDMLNAVTHDVKVNDVSVVANGVASIPVASASELGVVKVDSSSSGVGINSSNQLTLATTTETVIRTGTSYTRAILPINQHWAVFYGLAKAAGDSSQASAGNTTGTYTETAQSKISDMLNAPVSVTGSTPSITGQSGIRYICGEVTTISITPPESGDIEVIFTSGATPAVLTVPNTVKFPAWFDPSDLDASSTYDIIITNGTLGVVASWAS